MPVLTPGVAVPSREPTLLVENKLEVGSWRFRLTVVDDTGLESDPSDLVVRVVEVTRPVPVPTPAPAPTRTITPLTPPIAPTRTITPITPITPVR